MKEEVREMTEYCNYYKQYGDGERVRTHKHHNEKRHDEKQIEKRRAKAKRARKARRTSKCFS